MTLGLTNTRSMPAGLVLVPAAIVIMGVFGYLLDVRAARMFGQSQIAVVILTIALGFVLRFVAGLIWDTTGIAGIADRRRDVRLRLCRSRRGGHHRHDGALTVALYFYFNMTRLGIAMRLRRRTSSPRITGIPVKRVTR